MGAAAAFQWPPPARRRVQEDDDSAHRRPSEPARPRREPSRGAWTWPSRPSWAGGGQQCGRRGSAWRRLVWDGNSAHIDCRRRLRSADQYLHRSNIAVALRREPTTPRARWQLQPSPSAPGRPRLASGREGPPAAASRQAPSRWRRAGELRQRAQRARLPERSPRWQRLEQARQPRKCRKRRHCSGYRRGSASRTSGTAATGLRGWK